MKYVSFQLPKGAHLAQAALADRLICWSRQMGHEPTFPYAPPPYDNSYAPVDDLAKYYVWTNQAGLVTIDAEMAVAHGIPIKWWSGGEDILPQLAAAKHGDVIQVTYVEALPRNTDCTVTTPVITGVQPMTVTSGGYIVVQGLHMSSVTAVNLFKTSNNTRYSTSMETPVDDDHATTMVVTSIPVGTYYVEVAYPGGVNRWAGTLTVVAAPAPTLTSVSPNPIRAQADNVLTVNGTNFVFGAIVTLGGDSPRTADYVSPTQLQITLRSDEEAGTWTVQVKNPDGKTSNVINVTFN